MIVLVMGVSGSGKSTIGPALASALGWPYLDADDFHPAANIAKMASGTPLTDADRAPWLMRINEELLKVESAVLGCSALKHAYREALRQGVAGFRVAYLRGTPALIAARVGGRKHRYMPASLLDSQFATLEPPRDAIDVDVSQPVERCVAQIVAALRAS